MTLTIDSHTISKVHVIDDDPHVRDGYRYIIEDMDLIPVLPQDDEKYTDVNDLVARIEKQSDATICDFNLKTKNFASFYGSEAVARLYSNRFPALLCTRYGKTEADNIRTLRSRIPVLLTPDELAETFNIEDGFRQCIEEFKGHFRPSRQTHRTLVCIDDYKPDRGLVFVVVPAWDSQEVIGLDINGIPNEVIKKIEQEHPCFHAQVNIGAETYQDIYIKNWELE